jgi:predicted Holliday junction resolvase-like endonuclease
MTLESLTIIFLIILTVFLILLCVLLAYLYFAQKRQTSQTIEDAQASWRLREIDNLRVEQTELAHKEALAQLESWRQQELELARKQQLETARNEAQVQLEQWKIDHTQAIRQEAINKSQAVIAGKITEHFVPYLPEFTYNPKDARFLGTPIDFVIFDGLDEGQVKGIVFAEIKTETATLNTRERQIRDAVQSGKISWKEIRHQLNLSHEIVGENDQNQTVDKPMVEGKTDLPLVEKKNASERIQSILKR